MQVDEDFARKFPYRLERTNLPGAYFTAAPPDDFDPNSASAAALLKHGLPWRRPEAEAPPAALAAWRRAFSRRWLAKDRIIPEFEPIPGKTHHLRRRPEKAKDGTYANAIWSGCALSGPPASWNGIQAFWQVPTVSVPPEPQGAQGGWDSSSWAGIDGYGTNDVVQAGVQQAVDAAGHATYVAWVEWFVPPPTNLPPGTPVDANGYPLSWVNSANGAYQYIYQSNIKNFSVQPGDTVICAILYTGNNTAASVQFANETTGHNFQVTLKPPPGALFDGSTVEWIMENPNTGWPNASLAKFTPVVFTDAFATVPDCPDAGLPSSGDILNMVVNGKQVATASANGTTVTITFTG